MPTTLSSSAICPPETVHRHQYVACRADVVHTQSPDAVEDERRKDRGVGELAFTDRTRGAVRSRQQFAEEPLAAGAYQHREAEPLDQTDPAEQLPVLFRLLG